MPHRGPRSEARGLSDRAAAVLDARRRRPEAKRVEYLYTMYTTPGFTDERIHVYMAVGLSMKEAKREDRKLQKHGK